MFENKTLSVKAILFYAIDRFLPMSIIIDMDPQSTLFELDNLLDERFINYE